MPLKKKQKKGNIDDRLLMVVITSIYKYLIRALIDSDATKGSVSLSAIQPLVLEKIQKDTFFELGDAQEILSKGRDDNVPVVIVDVTICKNLTIT